MTQNLGEEMRAAARATVAAGLMLVLVASGCQSQKEPTPTAESAAAKSKISVKPSAQGVVISTGQAQFTLAPDGSLTASLGQNGTQTTLESSAAGGSTAPVVTIAKKDYPGATLDLEHAKLREAAGKLGKFGEQIEATGKIGGTDLEETVTVEVYDDFPGVALLSARLMNTGKKDVALDAVTLQRHAFDASVTDAKLAPHDMWSFMGSSLMWGKDEIFQMPAKFSQENPFGAPVGVKGDLGSAGGGIPVVAFWTRNVGEAIGHIETIPLVIDVPVETAKDGKVEAGVKVPVKTTLKANEVFSSPRTFLAIYNGDYYKPLSVWSDVVEKEGLAKTASNNEDYAVAWCGWGYEFGVTTKQMLDTIPKLKELGIHWATLDDGWFNNYGDWGPRLPTFAGNALPDMVKQFHDQGIKVQLWWLPLAVEDGHYGYGGRKYVESDVLKQHPDWLILNKDGKPARMARNLATLCPAVPEVQEYYKQLTTRFIKDWGFDGSKLDNIYSVPACYNPKHHHKTPNDSTYAMGDVYKVIFETTRALKPDSVTQSCPCGTPPSLAWLRYMDQGVTADPVGSVQVRRRVKMYKALLGARAAVYGDHVELTRISNATSDERDLGEDFASTLGTGGVLGTKFTWPDYGAKFKDVYLSQEKEDHWKKWIALYNQKLLSKGNFLDLYVYGYDTPEAYAIEKDGDMYYAFFAPPAEDVSKGGAEGTLAAAKTESMKAPQPKTWGGEVELRGLETGKNYKVTDYVNQKDYGTVTGPTAKLKVDFTGNLLLEAAPAQ
jgi:alpha-galactosidase